MNLSRRGFLGAMLAAAAAPAIVKSDSLMRVVVPRPVLLTLWGDGVRDDSQALQALVDGQAVMYQGREFRPGGDGVVHFPAGTFAVGSAVALASGAKLFGNGVQLRALHKGPMLDLVTRNAQDVYIRDFHFIGLGESAITMPTAPVVVRDERAKFYAFGNATRNKSAT